MKRLLSAWIVLAMLFSLFTGSSAMAADKLFVATLEYDGAIHEYSGTYFDIAVNGAAIQTPIPPIVLANGRSIVPVREIFEAVGANVYWTEGNPASIVITLKETVIALMLDSNTAVVNGQKMMMEVPAKLVSYEGIGKTMVPVRFVAETLNMQVDYDAENARISIYTKLQDGNTAPQQGLVLNNVQAYQSGEVLTAEFHFGAEIQSYNSITLENPNRVVVDVNGAKLGSVPYTYPLSGNISQIRFGEHETYLRIVFDAAQMPQRRIKLSEDKRVLTVLLTTAALPPEETITPTPQPQPGGAIVVIDAGHGGSDPGAIGYDANGTPILYEKDVNLNIAQKVFNILQQNGVNVYMTRNDDSYVTLSGRTEFANGLGASLFVSIHCNSFTSSDMNGSLVMHHTDESITGEYGVNGRILSNNILKYLPTALGTVNKGRVDGNAMYVIRKANMPSVIVETAFISNAQDRVKLADEMYREAAAKAIAQGILDTLPMLKK